MSSSIQPSIKKFFNNEAECDSESNNDGDTNSLAGSNISNLLSDTNVSSPNNVDLSFYRRIDNGDIDKSKCQCNYCGKQISRSHRARHERSCRLKVNCQYCEVRVNKELFKDHLERGCKSCKYCPICEKVWDVENYPPNHKGDCEVQRRLADLRKKSDENKLKELQAEALGRIEEYDEYVKACNNKGYHPKRLERWMKENKRDNADVIEVASLEFKGKNSSSLISEKKGKNSNNSNSGKSHEKSKAKPKAKPKQKAKAKKRKKGDSDPEDEDDDEETELEKLKKRKPSTIFQATLSLPFIWVFQTLILLIKKINDGYFITTRRKTGGRVHGSPTSIFPKSHGWGWYQIESLQKKTKNRRKWRKQRDKIVRNIPHLAHFDWRRYREFLGTASSRNLWKINFFRRQWIPGLKVFKEYIFSKERGLDADPHIHVFVRTSEKMLFNKIRLFFRRFKVNGKSILRDVKPCKSAKSYMRYVTKEDYNACIHNIDKESLNDNYIMFNFAKQSQLIHPGQYACYRWRYQSQLKKYMEIHDWFWKEKQNREDYELAMQHVHMDTLNFCKSSEKKGLYLYGAPGTGKSTVAFALSEGNFYMVTEDRKFAFHAWHGEENLLFEDFNKEQLLKYRLQINQLTDMYGKTTAERKGSGHVRVSCKRLIVTSNCAPPTEDEWPGFERRFLCVYFHKQD